VEREREKKGMGQSYNWAELQKQGAMGRERRLRDGDCKVRK
jgi:hypothetical protein